MKTQTVRKKADADSPLEALIKRARRSKRMAGADESAQSGAERAAYARLGRLIGR